MTGIPTTSKSGSSKKKKGNAKVAPPPASLSSAAKTLTDLLPPTPDPAQTQEHRPQTKQTTETSTAERPSSESRRMTIHHPLPSSLEVFAHHTVPSTHTHFISPNSPAFVSNAISQQYQMERLVAGLAQLDEESKLQEIYETLGINRSRPTVSISRAHGVQVESQSRRSGKWETSSPFFLVRDDEEEQDKAAERAESGERGKKLQVRKAREDEQEREGAEVEDSGAGKIEELGDDTPAKKKKPKKKKKKSKGSEVDKWSIEENDAEGEASADKLAVRLADEGRSGYFLASGKLEVIMEDGPDDESTIPNTTSSTLVETDMSRSEVSETRGQHDDDNVMPSHIATDNSSPINFLAGPLSPDDPDNEIVVRNPSSDTAYPKVNLASPQTFGSIPVTPPSQSAEMRAPILISPPRVVVESPHSPSTGRQGKSKHGNKLPKITIDPPQTESALPSPVPTEVDPSSPTLHQLDVSIVSRPGTPATFESAMQSRDDDEDVLSADQLEQVTAIIPSHAALTSTASDRTETDGDSPLTPSAETPGTPSITPIFPIDIPSPMDTFHPSASPLGSPLVARPDGFPFPSTTTTTANASRFDVLHPLAQGWTLHFSDSSDNRARIGSQQSTQSYSQKLVRLFDTKDVADLCGKWKALRRKIAGATQRTIEPLGEPPQPSEMGLGIHHLQDGMTFHFFVDGVQPMWEDPACAHGGKLMFTADPAVIDARYMDMVLILVSDILPVVCPCPGFKVQALGAVLSRKKGSCRLELWIGGSDYPPTKWIEAVQAFFVKSMEGAKPFPFQAFYPNNWSDAPPSGTRRPLMKCTSYTASSDGDGRRALGLSGTTSVRPPIEGLPTQSQGDLGLTLGRERTPSPNALANQLHSPNQAPRGPALSPPVATLMTRSTTVNVRPPPRAPQPLMGRGLGIGMGGSTTIAPVLSRATSMRATKSAGV